MAKKKNTTPADNYQRAVSRWRASVRDWLKAAHGRQQELATVLQVERYKINDWFVSERKEPPLWVVWAIKATLILAETTDSFAEATTADFAYSKSLQAGLRRQPSKTT
jgi:hypothetical protein